MLVRHPRIRDAALFIATLAAVVLVVALAACEGYWTEQECVTAQVETYPPKPSFHPDCPADRQQEIREAWERRYAETTPTPKPDYAELEPIEIGADELLAAFDADDVAARAEYAGRYARINGMIGENSLSSTGSGGFIGVVGGDYVNGGVVCYLGAEDYEANKDRQPGDPITIAGTISEHSAGRVSGEDEDSTYVVIDDCWVEIDEHSDSTDAPPEVDIEIGAGDLFAAFDEDTGAALDEYPGQYARIHGMIRETYSYSDDPGVFIEVAGGDHGNGVSCYLEAEDYEPHRYRQPGEPITITGTISDTLTYVSGGGLLYVTIDDCRVEA